MGNPIALWHKDMSELVDGLVNISCNLLEAK